MSQCYYTDLIQASDCIGDSLQTINVNFSALDQALCDVPQLLPGNGVALRNNLTEQERYTTTIDSVNSIVYKTTFESLNNCSVQNLTLSDGTTLQTTVFPYEGSTGASKPLATFTTTSLTNSLPKVTLYWLASGVSNTTITATNSAGSTTNKGPIWFNDSVTALKQTGNTLYVGGKFTKVGGTNCRKFCTISLSGNNNIGSLESAPFGFLELETEGTVNAIEVGTYNSQQLIAIGGSFASGSRGRSLSIIHNGIFYPFYVNGTVNALALSGDQLVVGGDFNYINYGATSASIVSGRRVLCRGFVKISLANLLPPSSNGDNSMTPLCPIFSGKVLIHTLTTKNNVLYAGGLFQIKNGDRIVCQNACAMNLNGARVQTWNPIFDGPVHTLVVDDRGGSLGIHLFVGGAFSRYYRDGEFYNPPRPVDSTSKVYNACVLRIDSAYDINTQWKPKFNGPVVRMELNDNTSSGSVYCYGKFSVVNDESCSFLCNIFKADGVLNKSWRPSLETGPDLINNALIKDGTTIIVGGNFSRVDSVIRYHLAKINDIATVPSLSSIAWDLGAQVGGFGLPLRIDTTAASTVRVSSYPFAFGTINETAFAPIEDSFNGLSQGQLVRFFVRRPGNSNALGSLPATDDLLKVPANVVGYKIDFNN